MSRRFRVEKARRVSHRVIGHQPRSLAWTDGASFSRLCTLISCLTAQDSIRILPHLQDTGGFFLAVLEHKQSRAFPKYRLTSSLRLHTLNVRPCREGKRSAQDLAEVPDGKKARLDGDEDVLMAPASEPPESKSMHCPFHERN